VRGSRPRVRGLRRLFSTGPGSHLVALGVRGRAVPRCAAAAPAWRPACVRSVALLGRAGRGDGGRCGRLLRLFVTLAHAHCARGHSGDRVDRESFRGVLLPDSHAAPHDEMVNRRLVLEPPGFFGTKRPVENAPGSPACIPSSVFKREASRTGTDPNRVSHSSWCRNLRKEAAGA
jgi:hypothetical protein